MCRPASARPEKRIENINLPGDEGRPILSPDTQNVANTQKNASMLRHFWHFPAEVVVRDVTPAAISQSSVSPMCPYRCATQAGTAGDQNTYCDTITAVIMFNT